MRIRKNAKASALWFCSSASALGTAVDASTHVCRLNQSPWDVAPDSSSSPDSYQRYQVTDGDESVAANGSLGDSVGEIGSVVSMKSSTGEDEEEEPMPPPSGIVPAGTGAKLGANTIGELNEGDEAMRAGRSDGVGLCTKGNGKRWHCRRTAKEGHSWCDYHLVQLRTSAHTTTSRFSAGRRLSNKAVAGADGVGFLRRRRRAEGNKSLALTSSDPSEFYYYSGFGPLWSKRRGGGGRGITSPEVAAVGGGGGGSCIGDHGEVDSKDGEAYCVGQKRRRKAVKARSLKSLM